MRVSCEFHFDSAHRLPFVPEGHKCGRLHGHTYTLTVVVDGPVGADGFVVDFDYVKRVVDPIVDQLDRRYLNDVPGLDNPTVEVQLVWLWQQIMSNPSGALYGLVELVLQEGKSNAASYRGPDHRVAFGQVTFDGKQLDVSTVWLGIDHNFSRGEHRPHIFETMVFGDCDFDQDCVRYSTEQDALEGHRRTMEDLAMGRKPWWL